MIEDSDIILTKQEIIEEYGLKLVKKNVTYITLLKDYGNSEYYFFNKDIEGCLKFTDTINKYVFIWHLYSKPHKKYELEVVQFGKIQLKVVYPDTLIDSYDIYKGARFINDRK